MYNFLVTGNVGAWNLPAYEYDRSRFGEHTAAPIRETFAQLTAAIIEQLKSFPCLFAYEGTAEELRVGYLRQIKERNQSIYIEYEFDTLIAPFPFSSIANLQSRLDIGKWEMNRTHWAIKDEDLFQILLDAELIDQIFVNSAGQLGRVDELNFKVALSFPGEKRGYVEAVAVELKKRLPRGSVFYDRDFTSQLARPNLDTLLQKIYLSNSDLVVVFLSSEYEEKQWCGIEWRAIREIIKNRSDHSIMLMKFDDASISGTFTIDGYVDLRLYTPEAAAIFIVERVRLNEG